MKLQSTTASSSTFSTELVKFFQIALIRLDKDCLMTTQSLVDYRLRQWFAPTTERASTDNGIGDC